MRCDEILRSEEGDKDHHTRRKQMTRSSKKVHGNDGGIDETAENGSAAEHAEASKRLKFLDDEKSDRFSTARLQRFTRSEPHVLFERSTSDADYRINRALMDEG